MGEVVGVNPTDAWGSKPDEIHQWQRAMRDRFFRIHSYWRFHEIGLLCAYPSLSFGFAQWDEDILPYGAESLDSLFRRSFPRNRNPGYGDLRDEWHEWTRLVRSAVGNGELECKGGVVASWRAVLWMHAIGREVPPEWLRQSRRAKGAETRRRNTR